MARKRNKRIGAYQPSKCEEKAAGGVFLGLLVGTGLGIYGATQLPITETPNKVLAGVGLAFGGAIAGAIGGGVIATAGKSCRR